MMTIEEIIRWAESKNCRPRREGGTCEHEACIENDRAIAVLRAARKFTGTDEKGMTVSGWLLPDA